MRVFPLTFTLVLLFDAAPSNIINKEVVTSYRNGKVYSYFYEGTVKSGLPNTGKEYTGLKIACRPQIALDENGTAILKLLTPRLYEYNKTNDVHKDELLKVSSLSDKFSEELQTPVKFDYVYGKILNVYAPEYEPEWILNIKKGVLSLLNLDLASGDGSSTFTTYETGVVGECETLYDIVEATTDEDRLHSMKITKVKNMNKCLRQPTTLTSLIKTRSCDGCDSEENKMLRSGVVYHYDVTGSRTSFLINSVFAEGQHVFTPFIESGGSAVTITKQNLTLLNVNNLDNDIELPAMMHRGDLMFKFPKQEKMTSPHASQKKVNYLLELLTNESHHMKVSPDSPSHFNLLVKSLRECKSSTIAEIFNTVKSDAKKKEWLMEGINMMGNEQSIQLIQELIDDGDVREVEIAKLLSGLVNVQEPMEYMLDDLMTICLHDVMVLSSNNLKKLTTDTYKATIAMRRSCLLSFGTLLGKFCSAHTEPCPAKYDLFLRNCEATFNPTNKDTLKERVQAEEMSKILSEEIMMKHLTEETKLTCVKSMGNAGLKSHVNEIATVLRNEENDNSLEVRVSAVHALRKIAPKVPNKVLAILMPIYRSPEEDPELRIAAYLVILKTKPSLTIYTLLAEHLKKETSKQVGSFVYSHLMGLANTTDPHLKQEAHSARLALHFARPFVVPFLSNLHISSAFHKSVYLNDLKLGGFLDVHNIFTHNSILPRSVTTKVNINLLGQNIDLLEAGVRAEGLQDVLEKFFGPKGFWDRRQSVFDFLKRPKKDTSRNKMNREVDAITDKVDSRIRTAEEVRGSLYVRFFDDEMTYETFSEDDMKTLITEGRYQPGKGNFEEALQEGRHIVFQKATLPLDVEYQVATILGLPLSLNVSTGLIMKLKVSGSAKVKPSVFHHSPTELEVDGMVNANAVMTVVGKMGVDSTLIQTGVAVNATTHLHVPVKASLTSHLLDKKHTLQVYMQEETKREIFTFNHSLYTFKVRSDEPRENFTKMSGHVFDTDEKNTTCLTLMKNSLSFCADYDIFPRKTGYNAFYPFTGPSYFNLYSLKGYDMPRRLEFVIDLGRLNTNPHIKEYEVKMTTVESPKEATYTWKLLIDTDPEDCTIELQAFNSRDPEFESKMTLKMTKFMEELVFDWNFGKPKFVVQALSSSEELTSDREYRMVATVRVAGRDRNKLHVKTVYTELPETVKTIFKKLEMMLPKYLYRMPYSVTVEPKLNAESHTVEMTTSFTGSDNIEMVLKTPLQEITVSNVSLPVSMKTLLLYYEYIPGNSDNIKASVVRELVLPTCTLYSNGTFKTFDDVAVEYEMPGSCPHVLVQDCSPHQRFVFLAQMKSVASPLTWEGVERRLKVIAYVDENKVEMYATTWNNLEVKVNGHILDLHHYSGVAIIPNLGKVMGTDKEVSISTDVGLDIYFSQGYVQTQVSGWYFNRLCGLCGDYDGETFRDLTTPTGKVAADRNVFGLSWLVEGDGCGDEDCKLQKIRAHHLEESVLMDGNLMTCVSVDPVFMCHPRCRPQLHAKVTHTEVGFHCLQFKDKETVDLDKVDLSEETIDMKKDIGTPHECSCEPSCVRKADGHDQRRHHL